VSKVAAMSCKLIRKHLSDYVDRELTPSLDHQVSVHLETCDACREEARALGAMVAASAALGNRAIPRDVTGAVMSRISSRPASAPWWRRVLRPVLAAPVGAIAATLLILALFWPHPPSGNGTMVSSATDHEISMAEDYAIFRSEQAFSGGEGVLLYAELTSKGGAKVSR
jgi:anti-sigma factor RsiW